MAGGSNISIRVGCVGGRWVVQPVGHCCAICCPALQAWLNSLQTPQATDIYLDLSQATGVDSTFVGLLVHQAKQSADATGPNFHLLSLTEAVTKSLTGMHVLPLFDVVAALDVTPDAWHELPQGIKDAEQLTRAVIEAHQCLINADPRNAARFQPIVDGLSKDLQQKTEQESNCERPPKKA